MSANASRERTSTHRDFSSEFSGQSWLREQVKMCAEMHITDSSQPANRSSTKTYQITNSASFSKLPFGKRSVLGSLVSLAYPCLPQPLQRISLIARSYAYYNPDPSLTGSLSRGDHYPVLPAKQRPSSRDPLDFIRDIRRRTFHSVRLSTCSGERNVPSDAMECWRGSTWLQS